MSWVCGVFIRWRNKEAFEEDGNIKKYQMFWMKRWNCPTISRPRCSQQRSEIEFTQAQSSKTGTLGHIQREIRIKREREIDGPEKVRVCIVEDENSVQGTWKQRQEKGLSLAHNAAKRSCTTQLCCSRHCTEQLISVFQILSFSWPIFNF